MIRSYLHIIFIAALTILSCDEKFVIVNCNDCLDQEPVDALIEITLTPYENNNILLTIYEGNMEDNIIIKSFYIASNETEVWLKVNLKYTFTARYLDTNGNSCTVVNTAYPRVRYDTEQCEEPCYYIYDSKVKLRLKYKNF